MSKQITDLVYRERHFILNDSSEQVALWQVRYPSCSKINTWTKAKEKQYTAFAGNWLPFAQGRQLGQRKDKLLGQRWLVDMATGSFVSYQSSLVRTRLCLTALTKVCLLLSPPLSAAYPPLLSPPRRWSRSRRSGAPGGPGWFSPVPRDSATAEGCWGTRWEGPDVCRSHWTRWKSDRCWNRWNPEWTCQSEKKYPDGVIITGSHSLPIGHMAR